MRVSVITVTYNSLHSLRRTAHSVLSQAGVDFEYVIVDGFSTDGTLEYLKSFSSKNVRWISEPDKGIYEAMNKGTRLAQGDYCIFMNAGDRFVSDTVIQQMLPLLDETDIVLGNQIHLNSAGRIDGYSPSRGAITLENIMRISLRHQSCFIKRKVLIQHPYDENLRLVSDWKFFLERYLDGNSFKAVNVDVCFFIAGGATDNNVILGASEKKSVWLQHLEYRTIWEKPYNPSLFEKARNKILFYLKYLRYSNRVKLLQD